MILPVLEAENAEVERVKIKAPHRTTGIHSPSGASSDSPAARDFSAVAYFFARAIHQREHVPIGVIDSSWGGTPIDSWISLDSLSADASLMPAFATSQGGPLSDMQIASLAAYLNATRPSKVPSVQ